MAGERLRYRRDQINPGWFHTRLAAVVVVTSDRVEESGNVAWHVGPRYRLRRDSLPPGWSGSGLAFAR